MIQTFFFLIETAEPTFYKFFVNLRYSGDSFEHARHDVLAYHFFEI